MTERQIAFTAPTSEEAMDQCDLWLAYHPDAQRGFTRAVCIIVPEGRQITVTWSDGDDD